MPSRLFLVTVTWFASIAFLSGCASKNDTRLGDLRYELPDAQPEKPIQATNKSALRPKQGQYAQTIRNHQALIARHPTKPSSADGFYQLAKTYDLDGNPDKALAMLDALLAYHPDYKHIGEAYFRKADIHYAREEYLLAAFAYRDSIKYSDKKHHAHAYYMLGWAYFKHGEFNHAIDHFAWAMDGADYSKIDESFTDDLVASIGLAVSKIGGAEAISSLESISDKAYTWRIYDYLGNFYLEKDLFFDAARTYRQYRVEFPQSKRAVDFAQKGIEILLLGNFPSLALAEKANYVTLYGKDSDYLKQHPEKQQTIFTNLRVYLEELGRHYYVQGQTQIKLIQQHTNTQGTPSDGQVAQLTQQKTISFLRAANYYGRYVNVFPYDEKVYDILHLQAESLFQAEQYLISAKIYGRVAHDSATTKNDEERVDAAYAGIISYQKYLAAIETQSRRTNQPLGQHELIMVRAMIRFVNEFNQDDRAPPVLTYTANYLRNLGYQNNVISLMDSLLEYNDEIPNAIRQVAYDMNANLYLEQKNYLLAERNLLLERASLKPDSAEYQATSEQIAYAIYWQGKQLAASDPIASATQLLRIRQIAPGTQVQASSDHEAIDILMRHNKWSEAIDQLERLVKLNPANSETNGLYRKLALALKQNQQPTKAAEQYLRLADQDPDPQVRQEALFEAASLYETAEKLEEAAQYFAQYAKQYPEPTDKRMEANYRVVNYFQKLSNPPSVTNWLQQIVADHQKQEKPSKRSAWLSSWAKLQLANLHFDQFTQYPLTMPLIDAMQQKQVYFGEAVTQYEASATYGFADLITQATYKMGQIHEQFSTALTNFELPSEIGAPERDAYRQILDQQASPFVDSALDIYQANIERAWNGMHDQWIDVSFQRMRSLKPSRYAKVEQIPDHGEWAW